MRRGQERYSDTLIAYPHLRGSELLCLPLSKKTGILGKKSGSFTYEKYTFLGVFHTLPKIWDIDQTLLVLKMKLQF